MTSFYLSFRSLKNRLLLVILISSSLGLSLFSYLSFERIKGSAEESFRRGISGTDLIVGPRTGPLQLLLYSAFNIGSPSNSLRIESYEEMRNHPAILSAIPISIGDSHQGYRVIGTQAHFFTDFIFSRDRRLEFREGRAFQDALEVVLGAELALRLQYKIGDSIVLQHGVGGDSFFEHSDYQFEVVGILERTNTLLDESLLASLEGIEQIHHGWEDGAPPLESPGVLEPSLLKPKFVSAVFVRLKDRLSILQVQREINSKSGEPLTAIMPGVVFQELWTIVSFVDRLFQVILGVVLFLCFVSSFVLLWLSLELRRREMAIYRSLGAPPGFIFKLMFWEGLTISLLGLVIALILFYGLWPLWSYLAEKSFGISLSFGPLTGSEWSTLLLFISFSLAGALIPAIKAYREPHLISQLKVRL
jgi:putative ABC transport system permease protein